MVLKELVDIMQGKVLYGSTKIDVNGLSCDSRRIKNGDIFFCKGKAFKNSYVVDAIKRGTIAVVLDKEHINGAREVLTDMQITVILVDEISAAVSLCAAHFYGYPTKKLITAAITGTKGKTTTSHFLNSALNQRKDFKSALLCDMVDKDAPRLTTPEAIDFHKAAAKALANGYTHLVCEISSQAQKNGRVNGIEFDISCFLNLGHDHIGENEHKNEEDYFLCKAEIVKNSSVAVINSDCPYGKKLKEILPQNQKNISISAENKEADFVCKEIFADACGCKTLAYDTVRKETFTLCSSMLGRHNAVNMLSAYAMARELGVSKEEAYIGICSSHPNGRSELLYSKDKSIRIVVDYAHNEMSFTAISRMSRETLGAKYVTAIFGCPGDKAQCRRYGLALACTKNVDRVIICEDDSGAEGYEKIAKEMKEHFKRLGNENVIFIENREEALKYAVESSDGVGEVILFLGKGEETLNRGKNGDCECESDINIAKRVIQMYDTVKK